MPKIPPASRSPIYRVDPRQRSRTSIVLKCPCGRILYQGVKPPEAAVIQCLACKKMINARPPAQDVKKGPELPLGPS